MTTLIIVRHAETDWNTEKRFQGQANPALNNHGLQQSLNVRRRLQGCPIDVAYCSDLRRAHQTAHTVLEGRAVPLTLDVRLRERCFGDWQGLTAEEVRQRFPNSWEEWRSQSHFVEHRPENGETLEELVHRLESFLRNVREKHAQETVLVLGHGGSVKGLVTAALGIPLQAWRSFHVHNASITILETGENTCQLRVLNDTCHLYGIP